MPHVLQLHRLHQLKESGLHLRVLFTQHQNAGFLFSICFRRAVLDFADSVKDGRCGIFHDSVLQDIAFRSLTEVDDLRRKVFRLFSSSDNYGFVSPYVPSP